MARAKSNGIELEYETFGNPEADPILLVMGLGGQLIHWDEPFCKGLADRGHFVTRFDNRDAGLSTWFDQADVPDLPSLIGAIGAGEPVAVPYGLDDMADDAIGLLDFMGLERAHVCGVSMGGMIVQAISIRHPNRVLSMTSIMSSTGNPDLPPAAPHVMEKLLETPPRDREGNVARAAMMARLVGSPGYPIPEEEVRERAGFAYDRAFHPEGATRQLAAIITHGSRVDALRKVRTPTLVIHGRSDALVPMTGGIDTADAIAGAKTLWIDGMGHDLPQPLWGQVLDALHEHATVQS